MSDFTGQTVLVTGATGFLGGAVARRLADEGAHVRALARRPNADSYLQGIPRIETVMGNLTNAGQMRAAAKGCTTIIHVAAALGSNLAHQQHANVEGTRNVMQAAAAAGVERVVHVSSIAVYGYGYLTDVSEDTPQQPGNVPYNLTKSQAETVVLEESVRTGVQYSILRPGMIYGPRSNGWTATMFKLGKRKPTPFPGDGSGSAHIIYVDDVVDLALVLAQHPAAVGEAFNCASDPAPTWREFIGGYSRLAGHDRWLALPVLPFKLIAPLVDVYFGLRGEPQALSHLIPFMQARKVYRMEKARRLLGWSPRVSLDEGLERCAVWLRQEGLLR